METDTALVRTDCRVKLNTVTAINLNVAVVVNPRNSELNKSFGLNHSLNNAPFFESVVLFYNGFERF